jgi:hypothetical protein
LLSLSLSGLSGLSACGGSNPGEMTPGQTDFTTVGPASQTGGPQSGRASDSTAGAGAPNAAPAPMVPGAPGGRVAEVQEADIYRVDKNRLFYLNTYRGFVAYDVNDAKHPVLMGGCRSTAIRSRCSSRETPSTPCCATCCT